MPSNELQRFIAEWEGEAAKSAALLRALPTNQYDYRPDAGGRSLGELAWHLAEIDAYMTVGVVAGKFDFAVKLPGLERPRTVEALAPGYERVHREAVARVRNLTDQEIQRAIPFLGDQNMRVGDILWRAILHHLIHHRGQLSIMNRMAGGTSPGMFGPNREEMAAMQAKAKG